jgi:hypothetical protein
MGEVSSASDPLNVQSARKVLQQHRTIVKRAVYAAVLGTRDCQRRYYDLPHMQF